MKLSDGLFQEFDRRKLSPLDRLVYIDCCRRFCVQQRAEEVGVNGNACPVRLRWGRGMNSCGITRDTYRQARKRLVMAGLLDRCRDSYKIDADGRAKLMRDWFVLKAG